MPGLVLRQFLFLDGALVRSFSEQLPGGTRKELKGERQTQGTTSLGGSIGYGPAQAKAAREKGSTEKTEFEVRQSDAADFASLYEALEAIDAIQHLDAVDDTIWESLGIGEIVEVPASISQPKIMSFLQLADQFKALLPFANAFGQDIDPNAAKAMEQMDILSGIFKMAQVPIIIAVAGFPRYRFVASLKPSALVVDIRELVGEATVLGKIQRKIRKGQVAATVDLMRDLPEALRPKSPNRRSPKKTGTAAPPENFTREYELEIPYPAAVMTPLAIYR